MYCGILFMSMVFLYLLVKSSERFMFQSDACRKAAKELEKKYPESDFPVLVQAALLFREKQHQDAVAMLEVGNISSASFLLVLYQS